MKKILLLTISAALMLASTVKAQNLKFIPADDERIQYVGRISFEDPSSPMFVYPGTSFQINFTGTSLGVSMKPNSGYYMVELDGIVPFKVHFSKTDSTLILAKNLNPGIHSAKLMLVSEAYNARPQLRGFWIDPDSDLSHAPALSSRKLEFIGNSITCGYGVEAEHAKIRFSDGVSNHYYSYAQMTARAFGAQAMIVARSGIGIYRNYAGPVTGSRFNMPDVYENTLYVDGSQKWDFSRYTPDVVCINLGTNDASTTPYDTLLICNGYRNFIKTLRSHYPDSKLVFMTGTMLHEQGLQDIKDALDTVVGEAKKAGDKNIYRLDLTPADGSLGYGSDEHPSIPQNRKSASELIAFLKTITDWEEVEPLFQ